MQDDVEVDLGGHRCAEDPGGTLTELSLMTPVASRNLANNSGISEQP